MGFEPMGLIKNQLRNRIRSKLEANGVVVWYDKSGEDGEPYFQKFVTEELEIPNKFVYDGSFLRLRYDLLDLVIQDERPEVLIYVPKSRNKKRSPLLDLELMGGDRSVLRGTPWRVIEESLRGLRDEAIDRDAVRKMVESSFSLDKVDEETDAAVEVDPRIKAVFDTNDPVQIGLLFATGDDVLGQIESHDAIDPLMDALEQAFGFTPSEEGALAKIQASFCNHLLISEILEALRSADEIPPGLQGITIPSGSKLNKIGKVLTKWRDSRELEDSYVDAAERCEEDYGLASRLDGLDIPWDLETVPCTEDLLVEELENQAERLSPDTLLDFAQKRRETIWARHESRAGPHWALLEECGRLLRTAEEVGDDVGEARSMKALLDGYAGVEEDSGWSRLDRHHRKLEHHLVQLHGEVPLPALIKRARKTYLEVVDTLATRLCSLVEKEGGVEASARFTGQSDIYRTQVEPALDDGSVAYILVDALRYEMGQDLVSRLDRHGTVDFQPALARLPSLTKVGMTSLLPHADRDLDVTEAEGQTQVRINGEVFDTARDRVKYITDVAGVRSEDVALEDLIRDPASVRERLEDAQFVLVRSQEIDELGETGSLGTAHDMMTRLLEHIEKAVVQLSKAGIDQVVIGADHGYLLLESLPDARKLDPPGGQCLELHRRAWIGRGGQDSDQTLRLSAGQLGYSGDFDLVFPRGAAVFKAGGSLAYFHGGISPQELVIPAITATLRSEEEKDAAERVELELRKDEITSGVFLAELRLLSGKIPQEETRRIRVVAELHPSPDSEDPTAAELVASTEGLDVATQEVEVPYGTDHTLVFQMKPDLPPTGELVIRVIDPATEVELGRSESIPFELSF